MTRYSTYYNRHKNDFAVVTAMHLSTYGNNDKLLVSYV